MTTSALRPVTNELEAWLDRMPKLSDTEQGLASEILPRLGHAGVFRIGVPTDLGGTGGAMPMQ